MTPRSELPWQAAVRLFNDDMRALYGPRLREVVLYGSRARGDAGDDSDVDLLVVLDPLGEFWAEFERIAPSADRLSLAHDVVLSAFPADATEFREARRAFYMNVHDEGVRVA